MNERGMKISAILPLRDPDFSFLKRALDSVFRQTYQNFEILLVNDGSKQEAAEKLKRLAGSETKIRCFDLPPSGVSAARNFAAEQAAGDVYTYLDSDDMLHPACFEEAAAILAQDRSDAIWGGTFYGTNEEIEKRLESRAHIRARNAKELGELLVPLDEDRIHRTKAECIGEPFRFEDGLYVSRGIAGRFFRKEAMERTGIRFPEGIRFYEDMIWNLDILEALQVSYAKTEWYYYQDNMASVSNAFNPDMVKDLELPLSEIRKRLDLEQEEEYTGYTRILMDSLRYVCKCLYCNPEWNASGKEKAALRNYLYTKTPWAEIGSEKYKNHAEARDRKKAFLFRERLLLAFWKLTWKQG